MTKPKPEPEQPVEDAPEQEAPATPQPEPPTERRSALDDPEHPLHHLRDA